MSTGPLRNLCWQALRFAAEKKEWTKKGWTRQEGYRNDAAAFCSYKQGTVLIAWHSLTGWLRKDLGNSGSNINYCNTLSREKLNRYECLLED